MLDEASRLLARRFHWTEQQARLQLQRYAHDHDLTGGEVAADLVGHETSRDAVAKFEAWVKRPRPRISRR